MLRNLFLKTLRDYFKPLQWWGISLIGLNIWLVLFYPYIRDMHQINQLLETMPAIIIKPLVGNVPDMTSPAGYLNSDLFFLIAPMLFLFFTIGFGSHAIAGEEENGTLSLLLAQPLARWRVVTDKFAALAAATLILAFAFWAGLAIGAPLVKMDISLIRVAEATLGCALLGIAFGTLALALGCLRGNKSLSLGVTGAAAVAAYLLNSLALVVKELEPYQKLSPFYYYIGNDPLVNGLDASHVTVLIVASLVLLGIGLLAFQRRDIAT